MAPLLLLILQKTEEVQMIKLLILSMFLFNSLSWANSREFIDTLGVSPKGQYVALEEYGYKSDKHTFYVSIKIMNVWKKEYVGKAVNLEIPAVRPSFLEEARKKAKILAHDELNKFQISG
jgi:predicted secreted protein